MIVYEKEALVLLPQQGHCNKNYFLEKEKKRYLIREFQLADRDRKLEYCIQKRAALRGIAPKPLFLDETIMITTFISGVHRKKPTKRALLDLARALKKLHHIPRYQKPIRLPLKIRTFVRRYKKELVLSHGDLSVGNILFARHAVLLDWEYAGVQDRYFDLASILESFALSKVEERLFLRNYSRDINPKKLQAYRKLFQALSKAWFKKLQKGQLPFV